MTQQGGSNPLDLDPAARRSLETAVLLQMRRHFDDAGPSSVGRVAAPDDLVAVRGEPLPEDPSDPGSVLARLEREVWPNTLSIQHPRFFGFITSPSTEVGAWADALVSAFNPFAGTWLEGSGPAAVEAATVDWLRTWMELPEGWGGHFTAGGSAANLTALALARHVQADDDPGPATAYGSDQTHVSVDRALWLLGLPAGRFRRLPTGSDFRLAPDAVRRAVERDRDRGLRPFCVVANAGTTDTGAVDPLEEIAEVCGDLGLWLHVDGCYGLAAAFGPRRHSVFRGLERADSLSVDAHKWLFQPYECGCVMVRDPSRLAGAFRARAGYLQDLGDDPDRLNFSDQGLQLTRRFRALKLWLSFQVYGARRLRAAVERGIDLGRIAAAEVGCLDGWEVVAEPDLAVVAFRYAPGGLSASDADALQRGVVERVLEEGYAFVSSSVLAGRTVLRMNTINPRTRPEDIRDTVAHLDRVAKGLAAGRLPGSA